MVIRVFSRTEKSDLAIEGCIQPILSHRPVGGVVISSHSTPLVHKPTLINAVITIIEKEICRLSEIDKMAEETHPSAFDRNYLSLMKIALEALGKTRSKRGTQIRPGGKPLALFFALLADRAKEHPAPCNDLERRVLETLLNPALLRACTTAILGEMKIA